MTNCVHVFTVIAPTLLLPYPQPSDHLRLLPPASKTPTKYMYLNYNMSLVKASPIKKKPSLL